MMNVSCIQGYLWVCVWLRAARNYVCRFASDIDLTVPRPSRYKSLINTFIVSVNLRPLQITDWLLIYICCPPLFTLLYQCQLKLTQFTFPFPFSWPLVEAILLPSSLSCCLYLYIICLSTWKCSYTLENNMKKQYDVMVIMIPKKERGKKPTKKMKR